MTTHYAGAFRDQLASLRRRLDTGMPRLGWKVGINVPEIQRKLGLEHALAGWLNGEASRPSGSMIAVPAGARFHVEAELCLRMNAGVDPSGDREAALAAIDAIAPALELVDYSLPASSLDDVVRTSMFHAGMVLGGWLPPRRDLDIAGGVTLRVGAVDSEPARHDLVPGDAADLVLLVARLLAEAGESLQPGDHILSGSFVARALPLGPGLVAEAVLGPFGAVRCTGDS